MSRRVALRIAGRVQGVFFRWSAKELADRLGIDGFARNEADGTVAIEAGGEDGAVERFVAWCRKGPELARVERVDLLEAAPLGPSGTGFRVI